MRTLLFIKPDGYKRRLIGSVLKKVEDFGLKIVDIKTVRLNRSKAEEFYKIHRDKPFFSDLVEFITSGPIVACLIEGENAPIQLREIVGTTDPAKAKVGTIRHLYGTSIQNNVVHASAPDENPEREVRFFFGD
ncbi:MAG TPA: nucleoside-diphosphate kinase [bacterium (Candidatus Stahlbacteria)]|nr:nucleoside-diphosphate kinase [Candidatus Stahlbacteria bacterium]